MRDEVVLTPYERKVLELLWELDGLMTEDPDYKAMIGEMPDLDPDLFLEFRLLPVKESKITVLKPEDMTRFLLLAYWMFSYYGLEAYESREAESKEDEEEQIEQSLRAGLEIGLWQ